VYRANLVLVWPSPANDYWEDTFIDRSVSRVAGKLKPTYRLVDGRLEGVFPSGAEWRLKDMLELALGRWRHGAKYTLEQLYSDRWVSGLPSTHRVATNRSQFSGPEILQKDLVDAYLHGSRDITAVTYEEVAESRSHFSPFLKNMSDRDRYSVALTHALWQEMKSSAQAHGAIFRMFHPYRSDLDATFRAVKCVKDQKSGEYFEYDGSDWLRYLKQTSLAEQLIVLDIRSANPLYVSPTDWHLNFEGNLQVMDSLARALVQSKAVSLGKN
jgi:hypothetical protein